MTPEEKEQHAATQTELAKDARDAIAEHAKEEPIVRFFAYAHLPASLQGVGKPSAGRALPRLTTPRSAERTVALRKLLESKDAAVRAALP